MDISDCASAEKEAIMQKKAGMIIKEKTFLVFAALMDLIMLSFLLMWVFGDISFLKRDGFCKLY